MVIPLFTEADRIAILAAAKKRLIYLDSNIWIGIAENRNFPDAVDRCRQAVRSGKVLFPVSNASVTEVLDQPDLTQRARIAAIMDELSQGICYLPADTIHKFEADSALGILLGQPAEVLDRERTLSWVDEYLGIASLEFSQEWTQADAEKCARELAQRPELRSVKWIADHLPLEEMRNYHSQLKKRSVEPMAATIAQDALRLQLLPKSKRRQQTLLDLRIRAVEKIVSPRVTSNLLAVVGVEKLDETIKAINQRAGEGGEERLAHFMEVMPSLDLSCQIYSEWLLNSTVPFEEQDFLDWEHATVGGTYADFFVTSDNYLFDLLKNRCTVSNKRSCGLIQGLDGFLNFLKTI